MIDWKKYIITFIMTGTVFGSAVVVNNYFNRTRVVEMKSIYESISTDILASETQFSLISELSCKEVGSQILSQELVDLARKIEFTEQNVGAKSPDIVQLKKFYSLLEIKDYLLMKRITERCGKKIMFAFYFYSNSDKCDDCINAGNTLTKLREKYPQLRVYSFDYILDLSVIKTLISIFNIENTLPAMVMGDKVSYGYKNIDELEKLLRTAYPREMKLIDDEQKAKEEAEKARIEAEKNAILLELGKTTRKE
ncbi:MAG: hypothetical protein WC753_03475 [Candidatus Gracilibacteria bacterium]|jgi:hypothetical protein